VSWRVVGGGALFDASGGEAAFERLVTLFYQGVQEDAVLRPLYPEDLADPKRHLTLFLIQLSGGPGDYSAERGHPRLRMRHLPFRVDQAARDAWMARMREALAQSGIPATARDELERYFDDAATFLINS
jgi:hemoglobin